MQDYKWNHLRAQELSIAFSEDDGKTWTEPVVIARHRDEVPQVAGWLSYPTIFERRPGELWIVVRQGFLTWLSLQEEDFVAAP